ncbi:MAG: type II CRISPR RNA-guided endonuclease Cas9, partial [Dysgonamonadaceae bacterium]|nr:type II CRISPR RNA-guided endonuclease Cas9 [Dysgonamonadaceae bacterium]
MKKNILGLDLGITSIGWAHVIEGETPNESEIKQIGSRIIQFDNFDRVDKQGGVSESRDPLQDFASGKGLSPNADRTKKRGARRLLDRYQMRRENLVDLLLKSNIINSDTILVEDGKNTTHETWHLRSKAATERIELDELARVLLAINKKRGYKSSRKAKSADEGYAIDGMGIAKKMYEDNITPGQYVFKNMIGGRKAIPDFYRSDLETEFKKVWDCQRVFYPELLSNEFYEELQGKGLRATSAMFWNKYDFNTATIKDIDDNLKNEQTIKYSKRDQKKLQAYKWRSDAISKKLDKEQMAYVIADINNNINSSSGYLGAISDRSKELYFNNETVGQYLYKQLQSNPHTSLKNQVFYRQDYLDEFETIWTTQATFHPQLTNKLKEDIRDVVIFYQRKLKSQKSLISFCEFESKEVEIEGKKKIIGSRVAPKSSHLSQEFKIWQNLNNVVLRKSRSKKRLSEADNMESLLKDEKDEFVLDMQSKELLFEELNLKGKLKDKVIIELLGYKPKDWKLNYTELEGNNTNAALYNAYLKILEIEGYNEDLLKLSDKDDINVAELKTSAFKIKDMVKSIFKVLGIDTKILEFNAELEG